MAGTARLLCWALPAVVLATLVAGASATFWKKPEYECPAVPAKVITSGTCTYANGQPCPECLGKCCLKDGHCLASECNRDSGGLLWHKHNDCDSRNHLWFWKHHYSNCIGNTNFKCKPKYYNKYNKHFTHSQKLTSKNCPSPIANGAGACEPIDAGCPHRSKYCLGKVRCAHPNLCGNFNGATCVLNQGLFTEFHVCACDGGNAPSPPPPSIPDDITDTEPPAPRSPRSPRNPRAPATPDEPRRPRNPRRPRSPPPPAEPTYPEEPNAPRRPRRPRSPPPRIPDDGTNTRSPPRPPPPFVPSTCPAVDIPVTNQCRNGNGGGCSRCLGKCCLDDGFCASTKCNDRHYDAKYCNANSIFYKHYWSYTKSNCLGTFAYECPGSWFKNYCPVAIRHSGAVCAPINADCGRTTFGKWGHKFTWGKGKGCLGTISCSNKAVCGDWQGAPCIYQGHSKLNKLLNWCASDFEVCSCPLKTPIGK